MAIKLVLSAESIYKKVFQGVPRGYDPYEVDRYLDQVIKDYETVEANYLVAKTEIDELNKSVEELKAQNKALEIELGKYKTRFANIKANDNVTTDNIDLVKRINVLERFLWNNGFNPNTIK